MRIPTATVVVWMATAASAFAQAAPVPQGQWPPAVYLNDLGCAPHMTSSLPSSKLRIIGSADPDRHLVFGNGQSITINGGTDAGVQAGQEYFVRRLPKRFGASGPDFDHPVSVHTVGWVTIVSAEAKSASARVVHSCDALMLDDYLEPFAAPSTQTVLNGEVRYDNLARLMGGDEDRYAAGINQYMIIDRGADHGLKPGTRFVVLRDKKTGHMVEIGEGIVLQVRAETASVQITRAKDAIYTGDFVALAK
jgi:hypothetical protein